MQGQTRAATENARLEFWGVGWRKNNRKKRFAGGQFDLTSIGARENFLRKETDD